MAQSRLSQDVDAALIALGDRPTKNYFTRVKQKTKTLITHYLSCDSLRYFGLAGKQCSGTPPILGGSVRQCGRSGGLHVAKCSLSFYSARLPSPSQPLPLAFPILPSTVDTDYTLEELITACSKLRGASATSGSPTAGDFRPISLLNVDYKVWAATIAARVNLMLPGLCRPTQTGFLPGRQIMNNISFNRDIAQWARQTGSSLVFAMVDFEKAYDRVNWSYLFAVLARMHFLANIISDIRSLYSGFQSRKIPIREHQVTLRSVCRAVVCAHRCNGGRGLSPPRPPGCFSRPCATGRPCVSPARSARTTPRCTLLQESSAQLSWRP